MGKGRERFETNETGTHLALFAASWLWMQHEASYWGWCFAGSNLLTAGYNLLPILPLDGGQMLFCLIEMIFRRPVPQKIQEWGMRVGMALLLSLMIFATFNDVTRIINTPDEAPAVEKTAP